MRAVGARWVGSGGWSGPGVDGGVASKCGGALVRKFLSMELRVVCGWPDDVVDGSAGGLFVAGYPPRLQGFEVGDVVVVTGF